MAQIGGGQNRLKADSHFTHSHTLPKIAISLALLFSSANIALAEESGGFVGIGVGYGGNSLKTKYSYMGAGNMTDDNITKTFGGVDYGFVAGYKQFFTLHFGLRYYGNINLNHSKISENKFNLMGSNADITLINYSANVDFLGNFISNQTLDFGGFIGLGIGGNTWIGQAIDKLKSNLGQIMAKYAMNDAKLTNNSIDLAINVGLRANIVTHHGIELAVRVPIRTTKLFTANGMGGGEMEDYEGSIIHTYSILVRYTLSF